MTCSLAVGELMGTRIATLTIVSLPKIMYRQVLSQNVSVRLFPLRSAAVVQTESNSASRTFHPVYYGDEC